MKLHLLLMIVAAGLLGASCAGNNKPGGPSPLAGPLTPSANGASGGSPTAADVQMPAGAQWTLHCAVFKGPSHFAEAKALKSRLVAAADKTSLQNWWIVRNESESVLNYGFYGAIDPSVDSTDARRARDDMDKVKRLMTEGGEMLFRGCTLVRLDQADPDAPPEWNLASAKGFWTLEVAVFKDIPDRKKEAVEAVREARKMGIEAYYVHGEIMSMVCIGAWPEDSVARQEADTASSRSPDEVIFLFNGPVKNIPKGLTTPDGKPIRVLAPKFEILDPTMQRAKDKYPYHAIDGVAGVRVKDPQTGQEVEKLSSSYFVIIPGRTPQLGPPQPPDRDPGQVAPNPMLDPTGGGRLR